ncbi:MAG: cache domain-containing protein [Cellvibrionaceae bacterium]
MSKLKPTFFVLFFLFSSLSLANDTYDSMLQLIDDAKKHIEKVGKERAFRDFSDNKGDFVRGDLYVYVHDFSGKAFAHGLDSRIVGLELSERSAGAKKVVSALMGVVSEKGSGIYEYYWKSPTKKELVQKLGYGSKIDDQYWIGSGIYNNKATMGE